MKINNRIVFLSVTTQRGPEEVGGWDYPHLMRLAVACIWDSVEKKFEFFEEKNVARLIEKLKKADLVVGFNVLKFHYGVLSVYTPLNLRNLPTFDILVDIEGRLGYRLTLDHLAACTLERRRLGYGAQPIHWFREGEIEKIKRHCKNDVEIVRDLFDFGISNGYLVFEDDDIKELAKLPVRWDIRKIIDKTSSLRKRKEDRRKRKIALNDFPECRSEIATTDISCPQFGAIWEEKNSFRLKWYLKTWFIIVMMLFFAPVGIVLWWKKPGGSKIVKAPLSVVFFIMWIAIVLPTCN